MHRPATAAILGLAIMLGAGMATARVPGPDPEDDGADVAIVTPPPGHCWRYHGRAYRFHGDFRRGQVATITTLYDLSPNVPAPTDPDLLQGDMMVQAPTGGRAVRQGADGAWRFPVTGRYRLSLWPLVARGGRATTTLCIRSRRP